MMMMMMMMIMIWRENKHVNNESATEIYLMSWRVQIFNYRKNVNCQLISDKTEDNAIGGTCSTSG
jgi:hypothetical protein